MSSFSIHNKSPLFRLSVDKLLNNWTALELAVLNGQGGAYGKEIASWMRGAVEDFFYQNDDLMGDEVSEFISQIMNQELDTIVDDNSLEELGDALCSHFRLAMTPPDPNNTTSTAEGELIKLHLALDAAAAAAAAKPLTKPVIMDDDSSDDDDEAMETEENGGGGDTNNGETNVNGTSTTSTNHRTGHAIITEPDEEGWVTVVKSKKH